VTLRLRKFPQAAAIMPSVSGSGNGYTVSGLNVSNVSVQNLGTVVMQAETAGSGSFSGVTASGVGVPGAYNYAYPSDTSGAFTFSQGSGNSGWSTTPVLTTFPDPVQPGALTASPASLSFGSEAGGSTSAAQTVTVTNPGSTGASVTSITTSERSANRILAVAPSARAALARSASSSLLPAAGPPAEPSR
jgi:hypothetical protein